MSDSEESDNETLVPRRNPGLPTHETFKNTYSEDQTFDQSSLTSVNYELCPRDYHSSNFPSLMSRLGARTGSRATPAKKTQSMPERQKGQTEDQQRQITKKKQQEEMTFTEKLKRFHHNRWERIESVARMKLDHYDKYISDMNSKLKQQRAVIEKRAALQLQRLQRMEEMKREETMFHSPYGRMWRHHRTMQRRALSLEPMRSNTDAIPSPRSTRAVL